MTIEEKLDAAGTELAAARAAWKAATDNARKVAVAAHKAGMTEVAIAQALGVDRANTLRRWLGK
jgi:hypothetical protein